MSAATLLRLWKVMTTVYITEQMVSTGHIISMAGTYSLQQTLFISVPALPSEKNWVVFAQGRPCAISILADDVVLDLNGFALAASTEHTQGLVLVHVAAGVKNCTVTNGDLMTCSIGVFFELACVAGTVQNISVSNFLEKGILSYSPQGLTISNCTIGPNLSRFTTMSQELYALVLYGAALKPAEVCAWQNFSDDLSLAETSHVAGISIVPDAAHDAPYAVPVDTGGAVVLDGVTVLKLTMNFREHSLLLGVGTITNTVTKASGVLREVLPEWYVLRRTASRRLRLGFYPSLEEPRHAFITDSSGFLINTGDAPDYEPLVTSWVRGVDREGNAVRGVQAVLIVGMGKPTLTDVVTEMPVFATLSSRVLLPAPKFVEKLDLASAKRAFNVVVLPAPPPPVTRCCSRIGAAAYFSRENIQFNVQPTATVAPFATGTIYGVNAIVGNI